MTFILVAKTFKPVTKCLNRILHYEIAYVANKNKQISNLQHPKFDGIITEPPRGKKLTSDAGLLFVVPSRCF